MALRRIAVVSTSRADYWPLRPVVRELSQSVADLEVEFVLCGAHSVGWAGIVPTAQGASEVLLPGGTVAHPDSPPSRLSFSAQILSSLGEYLLANPVDIVVLLGDRFELLGVASAVVSIGIPIVHLHGGEVTRGSQDDAIRHAITKLASLHLCATNLSRQRILAMGEEEERTIRIGSPGLDEFASPLDKASDQASRRHVNPAAESERTRQILRRVVVSYHSPTFDLPALPGELSSLLSTLRSCSAESILITAPGLDSGAEQIISELERYCADDIRAKYVNSLGKDFHQTLQDSACLVGNSSAGIIEAPALGVPSINVGRRQEGRERAASVVQADTSADISFEIERTLTNVNLPRTVNEADLPYGGFGASRRAANEIVRFLESPLLQTPKSSF